MIAATSSTKVDKGHNSSPDSEDSKIVNIRLTLTTQEKGKSYVFTTET